MSERIRDDFEEWFKHNYSWFIEKGMNGYSLDRFEDKPWQYVDEKAHHDWRIWQASRESLVIELPCSRTMGVCTEYNRGVQESRAAIKSAIEKSGLKVRT